MNLLKVSYVALIYGLIGLIVSWLDIEFASTGSVADPLLSLMFNTPLFSMGLVALGIPAAIDSLLRSINPNAR